MRTVVRVLAQAMTLLLLITAVAQAQPTANGKQRARELYAQGQQLFRQGDFPAAQRAFEDAYRAVPNPVVLLSIAECQVRVEQFGAAIGTLRQYLTEKPSAPDRPQVEAQIANLEAKPGFVSVESAPPGAMIWVDGENTGYLTPNELSLRAGRHTIALQMSGYMPTEQSVEVGIGSRQNVNLTLQPEPAPAVVEQLPAEQPVEQPVAAAGRRRGSPAVWAATAVAGVTLITGTALGAVALKKSHEYDERPTKALEKRGPRLALFADVNFGIAAVAGATALVLYLTSRQPADSGEQQVAPQAAQDTWTVSPTLSARELGVAGQMRF